MTQAGEPTDVKKIDRMFRQHDAAPAGVVSALYRRLTQEWADLHTRPSTTVTVLRWHRSERSLDGFTTPGQIVDAIDAADHDRTNELLLALIRLFQAGHQLAGRIVLQALLPKLAKTASHAGSLCTSTSDTWDEDRRHVTIAEFWDVMAGYPVERRTTSVASNLALDTLHRVSGVRRPPADLPVDPHDMRALDQGDGRDGTRHVWLDGSSVTDPIPPGDVTDSADLLQVITWGLATDVITREQAQLLAAAYLPQRTTGYGFTDAAARLGLTQAAVRQRCSRAARKLADAVRADIAPSAAATSSKRRTWQAAVVA